MKKFLKRFLCTLLVVIVLAASLVVYKGHSEYKRVTSEKPLQEVVEPILKSSGFSDLDAMNPLFVKATVATEDERFYSRKAILDLEAIGRAILVNIRTLSLREGGSTIPQQVSKNLYFGETMTLSRKVAEYFVSRDLLQMYSKDEILAIYINMNYYGDGFYGVKDASEGYFNRDPLHMNDGEATLLAGLPQAPSYYQLSSNMEGARARQKHVLSRLVDLKIITKDESETIYQMTINYGGNHEETND